MRECVGPGNISLYRGQTKDGQDVMAVQIEKANGKALASLDLTKEEALSFAVNVVEGINTIWPEALEVTEEAPCQTQP